MSKKFLCICEGGNVRSVSLAFVLKDLYKQDAIACSWRFNSKETLNLLSEWADIIVLMQPWTPTFIPDSYLNKVRIFDVGEDRFGNPFHNELLNMIMLVVNDWKARNFNI